MAVRLLRIGVNIGLSLGLAVGASSFATRAEAVTASAPAGSVGYDVSYPQCTSANSPNPIPAGAAFSILGVNHGLPRSEERRVGKECRSWGSAYH